MAVGESERVCFQCGFVAKGREERCPDDGTLLRIVPKDPLVGTTLLCKYQVLQQLGTGGMSVVYKVRHVLMDRFEALKLLRRELNCDSDAFRRFQQESQAVSALRHENVVRVLDFGVLEDQSPYLTMEFLDGKDFGAVLKHERRLTVERALPLFLQICEGLFHAHSHGVVHRDIKPGNIIITRDSNGNELAVIVDFGIAKLVGPDGSSVSKLTRTGEIFGSPLFMSPEQVTGKVIDSRTDIYAVGCLFYKALTGEVPFLGATPMETMMRQMQDSPPPFRVVTKEITVPTELEQAILKCLAKDPNGRFQSMNDLRKALLKSVGLPVTDLRISARNTTVGALDDDTKGGAEYSGDMAELTTNSQLKLEQDELKDSLAAALADEHLFGKSKGRLVLLVSALVVATGAFTCLLLPKTLQTSKGDEKVEEPIQPLPTKEAQVFTERPLRKQSGSKLPHCFLSLQSFHKWRCCSDLVGALSTERPRSGSELGDLYIIAYDRNSGPDLKALAKSECERLSSHGIKTEAPPRIVELGLTVKVEAVVQILDYGKSGHGLVMFYSDNGQPWALQVVPRPGEKMEIAQFVEQQIVPAFTTQRAGRSFD